MDTQVVISRCRGDGERMPVTKSKFDYPNVKLFCSKIIFMITIIQVHHYYHSNLDISGHLTKMYIPLLYLNPDGLVMYSARTFPVYIIA